MFCSGYIIRFSDNVKDFLRFEVMIFILGVKLFKIQYYLSQCKFSLSLMTTKKYIKKVIVTNESASAEARGERLRRIRNLANLSRKDFCNIPEIKFNTYKGWELGRFGGLPLDGAERVVKRVSEEHVICAIDWLLYGTGQEPYVIPQGKGLSAQEGNAQILKEIMVFQSGYSAAIYLEIRDDALSPLYVPGDYVAGLKFTGTDISSILNQPCIVQLTNGETLCRYLREGSTPDKYLLLATNLNSVQFPQTIEVQLNFAAPVIRHYKF